MFVNQAFKPQLMGRFGKSDSTQDTAPQLTAASGFHGLIGVGLQTRSNTGEGDTTEGGGALPTAILSAASAASQAFSLLVFVDEFDIHLPIYVCKPGAGD